VAAVAAILILLAAACTGGAEPTPSAPPDGNVGPTATESGVVQRPTIVLAAESWPGCLNPILDCGSEPWARYSVFQHVLPRAMQLDAEGNYVPSPLLTQAPSLSNGGLRLGPPFTVAFHIRNQAVWDDGSPITSEDFDFTWRAIVYTDRSIGATSYRAIRSIDTTDPKTAIVEFREVTAQWPEFFGGSQGFILKRAAFPRADPARPNLRSELQRSIRFSGGPWVLDSWSGDQAVLARNDRYYGRKAALDHVVFVPRTDQQTEVASLLGGEVAAIFADPSTAYSVTPSLLEELAANPSVKVIGANSTRFEALWLNAKLAPLNDPRVREALLYAIDRQAIVNRIVRLNNLNAEVLNCGFVALPDLGPWCATRPFDRFRYDPELARRLLESAGYDCTSSPCAKSGKPLEIRQITNATSVIQTRIQELVKRQVAAAGIELKIVNFEGGVLFGSACPFATIQVTQCAKPAPSDGSITELLGCAAIPTRKTEYAGENRISWCNREADRLMRESDQELDPARRLELLSRVHEIQAEDFMGLPLFVVPVVSAWRTDKIAGPIGRYASSPYGLFFNMNEWHLPA
jgi:ABC-type transport system substrate-binding protein